MPDFQMISGQDAFVEHLNGPSLVKSMLKDDPEAELIPCVPGVAPLLQTYPSPTATRFILDANLRILSLSFP